MTTSKRLQIADPNLKDSGERDGSDVISLIRVCIFCRAINKSDFGSELILGLNDDNYELFNILIGKTEGRVYIESPEQLRRDFPKAARIGDGIQNFLSQVSWLFLSNPRHYLGPGVSLQLDRNRVPWYLIMTHVFQVLTDLNDGLVPSGVIIKKCRVLGAKHKRYRINFQADHWLSVKRVIVNTILNNYFRKSRLLFTFGIFHLDA